MPPREIFTATKKEELGHMDEERVSSPSISFSSRSSMIGTREVSKMHGCWLNLPTSLLWVCD